MKIFILYTGTLFIILFSFKKLIILGSLPRSYDSGRNYSNPPQYVKNSVFGNNEDYDSETHMQQLQIQVQLQQQNNNNVSSTTNVNNNANSNINNNNSGSAHTLLSPGMAFNNGNLESPPMSITSPGGIYNTIFT